MTAYLFGSIGTLVETSELQRQAFNDAFDEAGLDWSWDRDEYAQLLKRSGGQQRIADYASERGEDVDAAAVHQRKSERFRELLREQSPPPRPGVVETVEAASREGATLALVTTTSQENVEAVLDAVAPRFERSSFSLLVDSDQVSDSKPDPAAYRFALEQLGESAESCVAVEDNVDGVEAAKAAGISCIAFPGANTASHDYAAADEVTQELDPAEVGRLAGSAA